jgi:two-component sensor histidine kinase
MQARSSTSEEVALALRDAGHRVQTIASVHDRLWRNNAVHAVGLDVFLGELCEQLAAATNGTVVRCEAAGVEVRTEQAVTLGLLVNELVTNAIKYAYDDGHGEIRVKLVKLADHHLELSVADHGKGLPINFDPSRHKSLGIRLISSLSRQLGGEPNWRDLSPGTCFELRFRASLDD